MLAVKMVTSNSGRRDHSGVKSRKAFSILKFKLKMGTQGEYNTNKNTDPEVAYTIENIEKCRCPECPVQIGSRCVIDKLRKSKEEIKRSGMVPMPENVPGIYCSTDTATCTDIDTSQPCICGTCAVYRGYNLAEGEPADHFCRNGRAF